MVELDDLENELKFIGIDAPQEILDKCLEVCVEHNLDAEAFVEEWVAFAETNLGGNLHPTIKGLEILVRKQLSDLDVKPNIYQPEKSDIKVYTSSAKPDLKTIFHTYNPDQPKSKSATPVLLNSDHDASSFIPASYSPSAVKPSTNYAKRTDAGSVLTTYDPKQWLQTSPVFNRETVNILLLDNDDIKNMPSTFSYMFEVTEAEIKAVMSRVERIANILINKYSLDVEDVMLNLSNVLYGRVRCDGDGKLNASSVLLETINFKGNGRIGLLNLKDISAFSLFPGQIIAMRTHINPCNVRDIFTPDIIHIDATPNLPEDIPEVGNGLKIIVACGPFSLMNNLTYQPLEDLVKYVVKEQPDVLILVGPFVDVRHASVADGTMADTFRSHFETIMSGILSPLHNTHTQIVLIPSAFDAHHHCIYPTPPFEPLSKKHTNHVHMMPDPSLFTINGVVIGVTSVDVVFHIAKTELNYPPQSPDRIARFISHLLAQQSFYPLYPPAKNLNIDQGLLAKYARIPVIPHLMILPSNFGQFVKNVNGCVVINPERLAKGYVGGTFAQIQIYPNQKGPSLADNISCQIIKI